MCIINERIKELRKYLGLTQQAFADKIGISRNNIASYEIGKSNAGDAVVSLICRAFNVNETWLRTGEGEMLAELSREAELGQLAADMFKERNNEVKFQIMKMAAKLNDEQLKMITDLAVQIVEAQERESGKKDLPE